VHTPLPAAIVLPRGHGDPQCLCVQRRHEGAVVAGVGEDARAIAAIVRGFATTILIIRLREVDRPCA
jgi:hypothetical protein